MAETILPDVYIDVRAEGLIVPGRVTVGRLGVVGTASKGPIGRPVILGSITEARQTFGNYDAWDNGAAELTLVRALELAYANGATSAFAVRVAAKQASGETAAVKASATLQSASGPCVTLEAKTEGTWGNDVMVEVSPAEEDAFIADEEPLGTPPNLTLAHTPIVNSARNRIRRFAGATGVPSSLKIIYDPVASPGPGEVKVDPGGGVLIFGDAIQPGDRITASYVVSKSSAVKVTVSYQQAKESYTVVNGTTLKDQVSSSALVDAKEEANPDQLPNVGKATLTGGQNAATGADYQDGLDALLNEEAHIIVAAGQDVSFGDELDGHVQAASTDAIKHDRMAVVGSGPNATLDQILGHPLFSDRVIFVAPGIKVTDRAATPPTEVTLPGAYTAAAVAGLLARLPAHVSPTNKTLALGALEQRFTSAQLALLVTNRVLALEARQGVRVVKGITTTDPPFQQITTRRIVDYAKFGVRSAANPYIGLLNNERVRGAMRATINSFLTEMVNDEMLVSYELDVAATREEERQGIARVTMVLRPVFSIDYIKVTMFLE